MTVNSFGSIFFSYPVDLSICENIVRRLICQAKMGQPFIPFDFIAVNWAVCHQKISRSEAATMSKAIHLLLALLICSILPASASAVGKHPVDVWTYYHFNGTAFVSGPTVDGSVFVAVRERVRPVVLTAQMLHLEETALPDGAGVIAGICYFQSSGGTPSTDGGYKPCPRVPLQISTGGKELVTVETDDHGYFLVVLPAGTYSIGSGPFAAEITVERNITTLIPLLAK
jgi:hypothetical protein